MTSRRAAVRDVISQVRPASVLGLAIKHAADVFFACEQSFRLDRRALTNLARMTTVDYCIHDGAKTTHLCLDDSLQF